MKKKSLLVSGVVAMLLGGAGTGYFMLAGGAKGAQAEQSPAAELPPPPALVKVDPMSVPVSRAGAASQLFLHITLEVSAPENALLVNRMMPRLRDSYIRDLYGRHIGSDGKPQNRDLEMIRERLLAQTEKVLGPGVVTNVLILQAMRIAG